ncbi:MAG: zinc-ribbon domain-containing protein [Candidatus Saccharimonadales bacterium]
MNCPQCGQPIQPSATFCGNCGYALQAVGQPTAAPNVPTQPANVQPNPQSYVASAYNNPTSPQPVVTNMGAPTVSPSGTMAMPVSNSAAHPGEVMGIVSLILGVLGVPGSIIPIVGLVLGVAGVIVGSISHQKAKRKLSIIGIIISSLAILLSIGMFIYNLEHLHKPATTSTSSSYSSSTSTSSTSSLSSVVTPCFSTKVDSSLPVEQPTGCNYSSSSTTENVAIDGVTNTNINASNFNSEAKVIAQQSVSSNNYTVLSQTNGTFAGSQAYIVTFNAAQQNNSGILAFVLHPTSHGENIFIVGKAVTGQSPPSFGSVESDWQWK